MLERDRTAPRSSVRSRWADQSIPFSAATTRRCYGATWAALVPLRIGIHHGRGSVRIEMQRHGPWIDRARALSLAGACAGAAFGTACDRRGSNVHSGSGSTRPTQDVPLSASPAVSSLSSGASAVSSGAQGSPPDPTTAAATRIAALQETLRRVGLLTVKPDPGGQAPDLVLIPAARLPLHELKDGLLEITQTLISLRGPKATRTCCEPLWSQVARTGSTTAINGAKPRFPRRWHQRRGITTGGSRNFACSLLRGPIA